VEKTKKQAQVKNADCEELLEEMELEWPIKSYVCKQHKEECFSEYDFAIFSETKACELCHPKENDSLGG
jgi:hypothetical protein